MKGLVLYRSFYGNTQKVAEHMVAQVKALGHDALTQDLREKLPDLTDIDFVIVGAPTRMAGVTGTATSALKHLKKEKFSRSVALFDLFGPIPKDPAAFEKGKHWLYPGAIGKMVDEAKKQGLNLYPETLRVEVKEIAGPVVESDLDKAAAFVKGFIAWVPGPRS